MNRPTTDTARAEAIEAAIRKLSEAADLLSPYSDDPRVRLVMPQLEGMAEGCFHWSAEDPEYLVDLLVDLVLEARALR